MGNLSILLIDKLLAHFRHRRAGSMEAKRGRDAGPGLAIALAPGVFDSHCTIPAALPGKKYNL
jgi:hypothetical protein